VNRKYKTATRDACIRMAIDRFKSPDPRLGQSFTKDELIDANPTLHPEALKTALWVLVGKGEITSERQTLPTYCKHCGMATGDRRSRSVFSHPEAARSDIASVAVSGWGYA